LHGGLAVRKAFLYILLLFVGMSLAVSACKKPMSEEDKIKAVIEDTADRAKEKDLKGVLAHVSESYKDESGNDRNAIKGILFVYFQGYEKVGVFVRDIQVAVDGDKAEAQVKVILTGGEDPDTMGDIVPKSGGGYLLDLKLKKEDDEWTVVRAKWTDIGFTKAL
jgi:hypothetical protein